MSDSKDKKPVLSITNLGRRIDYDIMIGWGIVNIVLLLSYVAEVIKGLKPMSYAAAFIFASAIPLVICIVIFRRNPDNPRLRTYVISGYFIMYFFALATSPTILVYTYILPLMFMLILYHDPKLILRVFAAVFLMNILVLLRRVFDPLADKVTLENSKEIEIQFGLLILCFLGCYVATTLYDRLHTMNTEYIGKLDEKTRQIQRMTFQTVETIANTIDAKDDYTKGHSRRVADYSAEIARELGFDADKVENIRYIGLLHDIGKIGVPDAVLNKPGKLTPAEFDLMKKHTTIGGEILKDVGMMPDLDVGAKYHHERYDGKGYPDGLKGEEIPLFARIIGVADAFDAMTSNRIYRKHLGQHVVVDEIKRCRGRQFDPDVTDAFLRFLERLEMAGFVTDTRQEEVDGANALLNKIIEDQSKQLAENAQKDQLTKVYNRSAGERYITVAMREAHGYLFYLNIDDMRKINKEQGVRTGDIYLLQVVDLLLCVTPDIIVCRFGGDEFICYVPGEFDQDEIAAQMRQLLDGMHFIGADSGSGSVTASIGISVHDDLKQTYDDALDEADKALYYMKQSGKDGFYFYRQVEDLDEDLSRQELSNLVEAIRTKDNFSDTMVLGKQDFFRMYEFISDVVRDRKKTVELLMFTLCTGEGSEITIELRDRALEMVDKALSEIINDPDAVCTYSSTQRIVIFVDEDEKTIKETAEAILKRFYQMYGQHSRKEVITLQYSMAGLREDQ